MRAIFERAMRRADAASPVVEAATSGVSQIIDECGRVLAQVPFRLQRRPQRPTLYREGVAAAVVRPNAGLSMYVAWGYWLAPAAAGAGAVVTPVAAVKRRPRRPEPKPASR